MNILHFLFSGFICVLTEARGKPKVSRLSCDVAIVGGGISGLYVAETLLRLRKEKRVCLFEREHRFGGRIRDGAFQRTPHIPLSLGAWRIDDSHTTCWDILRRFNISTNSVKSHLKGLEARGFFARDSSALKKVAFPALTDGVFGNRTFREMLTCLRSHRKEAAKFPSLSSYMSNYLTSEGYQLWTHLNGFRTDFAREPNAAFVIDAHEQAKKATFKFSRPTKGLSALTQALRNSALNLGAGLYKNEEVRSIEEIEGNQFELRTKHFTVRADKLVVAVPVEPLHRIQGSVAERIKHDPTFKSIGFQVAFKGFALYEKAWWQLNSTGIRYLADENQIQSNSDCLGFTLPYSGRGRQGEAVLRTSYAKFHCAVKWGQLLKISKKVTDREIQRSLGNLFPGVSIPEPLATMYVYWDEGFLHNQRAGSHLTPTSVSDWAKRPFPGKNLFIVGEAYHPIRGWIEGALKSAQNALREGWSVEFQEVIPKKKLKQDIDSFSDMYSFS